MFEKESRSGLIVYLYYNRDAKKLQSYGDICYHSKKHRYVQLYAPTQEIEEIANRLYLFVILQVDCTIKRIL